MKETDFSFEFIEDKRPEDVIIEKINTINEATKGYVTAHIQIYDGPVTSYNKIVRSPMAAIEDLYDHKEKKIPVDIQEDLGEVGSENNRFEVFFTVKGLEHYKYRLMFVHYSDIAYPVTITLVDDLMEVIGRYREVFQIESMEELQGLLDDILNSGYIKKLIQNLIREALRRENSKT